jgi:hypothetical protein
MKLTGCFIFNIFFIAQIASAQQAKSIDSPLSDTLQRISFEYISAVNHKVKKYYKRIETKTERTLQKLSLWENKIKHGLLKINPSAAERLFGSGKQTFSTVLEEIRNGKEIFNNYNNHYDDYKENLLINLKYLDLNKKNLNKKFGQSIEQTKKKIDSLKNIITEAEALQEFIKKRKKELINVSLEYIGNSKYLSRINKEAWYYTETLKNYNEIFSEPGKVELITKDILNCIPAFKEFIKHNGILAGLFDIPNTTAELLPGMQTINSVQEIIQTRIVAMGPFAQQIVSENLRSAHSALNKLQENIFKNVLTNGGDEYSEMPNFKPNNQKTKTFAQRIDFGFNVQFSQSNSLFPSSSDFALTVAYKLNDRSSAGLGTSYKLGLGKIEHIKFTHEGIGFRSFLDWKLKGKFYLLGGAEINHIANVDKATLATGNVHTKSWQQSALLGIMKKFSGKGKWVKSTNLQLLYDFLAKKHTPVGRQWVFRVGYGF